MGVDRDRRRKRKLKINGGFFAMPTKLLKSPGFRKLSPWAVKLYCHIASQFDGFNNGKLTAVYSELRRDWGFGSDSTISKVKKELLDAGFIRKTALGNRRSRVPDRFAILKPSFHIDWTADMDETAIEPP